MKFYMYIYIYVYNVTFLLKILYCFKLYYEEQKHGHLDRDILSLCLYTEGKQSTKSEISKK
jgi:hypothetical protein